MSLYIRYPSSSSGGSGVSSLNSLTGDLSILPGIGISVDNSTPDITVSLAPPTFTTVFANGNLTDDFDIIMVDTTSNTVSLVLPDPGSIAQGKTLTFVNSSGSWDGTFGFTLNRNATDSIYYGKADGSGLQQVTSIIPVKVASFTLITDSSDWYMIGVMPF